MSNWEKYKTLALQAEAAERFYRSCGEDELANKFADEAGTMWYLAYCCCPYNF